MEHLDHCDLQLQRLRLGLHLPAGLGRGRLGAVYVTGLLQLTGEGNHTFQVRAVDASGESPPATFEWTTDVTAPSLPGDVVVEATAPSGAVVVLAALDNLDPSPRLDCAPASTSTFPLGTTAVSCTATDAAGNTSPSGTLTVTVRDTTPPTLAPHGRDRGAAIAAGRRRPIRAPGRGRRGRPEPRGGVRPACRVDVPSGRHDGDVQGHGRGGPHELAAEI